MNKDKLKQILEEYKKDFIFQQWDNEKYKWEAVEHFQDHWDINATNFSEMFMVATEKTYNLLTSMNNLPRSMISEFANVDQEATLSISIFIFLLNYIAYKLSQFFCSLYDSKIGLEL